MLLSWWDKLPPEKHPIYKICYGIICVAGLGIWMVFDNSHSADAKDVGAIIGSGFGGALIRGLFK